MRLHFQWKQIEFKSLELIFSDTYVTLRKRMEQFWLQFLSNKLEIIETVVWTSYGKNKEGSYTLYGL